LRFSAEFVLHFLPFAFFITIPFDFTKVNIDGSRSEIEGLRFEIRIL